MTTSGFDQDAFNEDVKVNEHNLTHDFVNQASLYAHYGVAHAQSVRAEAHAKLHLQIVEARLSKSIREKIISDGGKPTEKMIEQEVILSADYVKAANAYNEAKGHSALTAAVVESMRQRRDMLIQLGATNREEMKGELRMTGPEAAQRITEKLRSHNA